MGAKKVKLTKTVVDALKPGKTPYVVKDAATPGLMVRVAPSGEKHFYVYFRCAGVQRKPSLGAYDSRTFNVDAARAEAERYVYHAKRGRDLSAEKQEGRMAETVAELAEAFLKAPKAGRRGKAERAEKTVTEYQRQLKLHILPAWGKKKVAAIKRMDVEHLHERLSTARKVAFKRSDTGAEYARILGGKGGANRVLALVKAMFAFAEDRGIIPPGSSPSSRVAFHEERPIKRYLTGDELRRLGEAIATVEAEGHTTPFALAAIRLLIYTGARKDEILSLKWDFIDAESGRLRLPTSKTGEKTISLNRPAADVLAQLATMRTAGSPWVIEGHVANERLKNLQAPWDRVRKLANLPDLRIHDLRHLFGGTGAALGLGLTTVGALLGHRRAETTLRYSDLAPDPLANAAERIGEALLEAMDKGRARVVELNAGPGQPGGERATAKGKV
jgi:integrase